MRKNFHFILQGKGGVGKTTVSTFITQYVKDHLKQDYLAIDTDQVNASFASFKGLNVETINLMEESRITDAGWERLANKLLTTNKTNIIIDNGASSFVPLMNYAYDNDLFNALTSDENNYTGNVFIHTVIAGGEGLSHTLAGLDTICYNFKNTNIKIVVWINSYLGKVETIDKKIEDYEELKKNENEILYIVRIPIYKGDLFKKDLSDMLTNHKTFEEMRNDASVFIMSRSRYVRMQRELFEILDDINIIFDEEE